MPTFICSDRKKIHRILLNLLGNAIKFTTQGSITIQVNNLKTTDSMIQLRFKVIDTGIGIPEKLQKKVFERFFRVSPSYIGSYKGHGLGLHIAQTYVNLLGGQIDLYSEEGKGTCFYFDITCQKAKDNQVKPPKPVAKIKTTSKTTTKSPYLLLVEDNTIALKVLELLITTQGLRFKSATSGEEALQFVKQEQFDMVITDIGLPGISGFELTLAIRGWEQTHNKSPIPILGLTGHAINSVESDCQHSGMNDIFTKPATPEMVQAMVKQYLCNQD